MDLFTERLMAKKVEAKNLFICVLLFAAALLISAFAFLFLQTVSIIVIAASFVGAYYIASGILFKEIEYSLTNDELEIDLIMAKRKRKNLGTYNIKDFNEGGKYDGRKGDFLCPYKASENLYFLKNEKVCIIIDPNETMLRAFEVYMGQRFKR